ncbi:MAG: OmpH family outer membrane protein [Rhodobacteraceae bacterium]|nr:OmpH family outer membrane protein [Paracoccaceae bacterium]
MAGRRQAAMRAALAALLLLAGGSAMAQQAQSGATVPQAPILTLDRERLLVETRFGQAVEAQFQKDSETLIAENVRLEQALEAEERALTDQRPTLPSEEFRTLAEEFDTKTEAIRAAQDAKSRAITSRRDAERQRFLQAAIPVLADLMRESGAVAIFDKEMVILSLRGVDITDEAIARIDAVLGDGATLPEAGGAAGNAAADDAAGGQAPAPMPETEDAPAP